MLTMNALMPLKMSSFNRRPMGDLRPSVWKMAGICSLAVTIFGAAARGAEAELFPLKAFQGSQSCASSGCHGGGESRDEYLAYMRQDVHRRFAATLTRSGSMSLAESPATNAACTVCHAPMQPLMGTKATTRQLQLDGFSCENCHGAAEDWLLSHTRYDYSHGQRVAAGLRDLGSFYGRANACVACHQHIDPQLLENGHPELYFELAGQVLREPPHWAHDGGSEPAQWLTGQAVALRETSWHLAKGEGDRASWEALVWLLDRARPGSVAAGEPAAVQKAGDALARKAASEEWSRDDVRATLTRLLQTADAFSDEKTPLDTHIRRAQRLALGVERLHAVLMQKAPADGPLAALGQQIREGGRFRSMKQMRRHFRPAEFAAGLRKIETALP